MTPYRALASFLLSIALTVVCPSWAEGTFAYLDGLERAVTEAYNGFDNDLFETRFNALRAEYQRLNRPQEEIWALYAYGFEQEAERLEKQLELRLKTDEIVKEQHLDFNRVTVRRATLEGGLWTVLREAVTEKIGPSVRHDVMVYKISRALGFHMVPVTVLRMRDGKMISLHMMIRDHRPGDASFVRDAYQNTRLHILDFLTQQLDRHSGNWLTAPGGRIVAIDNDVIYGHENFALSREMIGPVSADSPPRTLSAEDRRALLRLQRRIQENPDHFLFKPMEQVSVTTKINILLALPPSCSAALGA